MTEVYTEAAVSVLHGLIADPIRIIRSDRDRRSGTDAPRLRRYRLGTPISHDTMRPLQAFDAGGRSRAHASIVQTLALAKESAVDGAALDKALSLVDWKE